MVRYAIGLLWAGALLAQGPVFIPAGGGKPASPVNSAQYNCAGAFCGSADFEWINTALSTPASPALSTIGTPGVSTYGYEVVARNLVGATVGSVEATIATGNATLNGTNKIQIVTVAVTGSTSCEVWKTTDPNFNLGLVASGACGATFLDTGAALVYSGPPNLNTTKGIYVNGSGRWTGPQVWQAHNAMGNQAKVDTDANQLATFNVLSLNEHLSEAFTCGNTDDCGGYAINSYVDYTNSGVAANIDAHGIQSRVDIGVLAASTTPFRNVTSLDPEIIINENISGNAFASYGSININAGKTVAGDAAIFYANLNNSGAVSGVFAAFLNENFAPNFAWYSRGGTNHLETGSTGNVGVEIEAHAGQTANLFETLASNGTTVLDAFGATGQLLLNADIVNPFVNAKNTQAATAPGAGFCDLRWIAGAGAGTGKLVAACGTSATEVTIVDNVGAAF